jgi:hypothetical protein
MLIENQKVKVAWHVRNKKYYEELGYTYTNFGVEFEVELKHLSKGSHSLVEYVCDYCSGKNQLEEKDKYRSFKSYNHKKINNDKDCCNHIKCKFAKRNETVRMNTIQKGGSVAERYPHLIKEWSSLNEKTAFECTYGSGQEVEWICSKNSEHVWSTMISKRTIAGYGCPFCSGRKVYEGNCLASTHSELLSEWDFDKNENIISPYEVSKGSHKIVWWIGKCGHNWDDSIDHRALSGRGCPFCRGLRVDENNCLATTHPHLIEEWDFDKNKEISPYEVTYASSSTASWVCKKNNNHKWEAVIHSRGYSGNNCPYCRGLRVDESNSLFHLNPDVANEWNYEKNLNLTPFDVTGGSNKKVWWICETCNHEWNAVIFSRACNGNGCPVCNESKGEKKIREFLQKRKIKIVPQYEFNGLTGIGGKLLKFDFAILNKLKELEFIIEYDGEFHFQKVYEEDDHEIMVEHDKRKNEYCQNNNIPLLRIPYWEFNNIEEILVKELKIHNLIN